MLLWRGQGTQAAESPRRRAERSERVENHSTGVQCEVRVPSGVRASNEVPAIAGRHGRLFHSATPNYARGQIRQMVLYDVVAQATFDTCGSEGATETKPVQGWPKPWADFRALIGIFQPKCWAKPRNLGQPCTVFISWPRSWANFSLQYHSAPPQACTGQLEYFGPT